MKREYPDRPIVGVGAVVVHHGAALIVKRATEPLQGQWSIPGGAVELGETMRAAVAREVLEETGLALEVGPVLDAFDSIHAAPGQSPRFHYVLIDFLCRPSGGELRAASDVSEARWVTAEELPAFQMSPVTEQLIRKALSPLPGEEHHLSSRTQ